MDGFDGQRYVSIYRLLAEILERDRGDCEERHLPYVLGDLARRIFSDVQYDPPDELLEETSHVLRSGHRQQGIDLANKLREHAQHLLDVTSRESK